MAPGLQTHIWNNNLRSLVMLAAYPFLIMAIIWACLFLVLYSTQPSQFSPVAPELIMGRTNAMMIDTLPLILGGLTLWFLIAYFMHHRMIMKLSGAQSVARKDEPELYNLVENLCIAQGVPMPKLAIIETHGRNAFASGINDKTFTITVTRGLMNALRRDELEAVLAHELAHIIHRDVRLLMVSIIFTGMVGLAFQLVMNYFRYGIGRVRIGGRNRNQSGLIVLGLTIFVILGIGYLLTSFMRFFISRKREYMADAGAVQMTRNPEAMIRALMRIAGRDHMPRVSSDIAMLYIENSKAFLRLFATHPPIDQRIRALALTNHIEIPTLISLGPAPKTEQIPHAPKPRSGNPWLAQKRRSSKAALWSSYEHD